MVRQHLECTCRALSATRRQIPTRLRKRFQSTAVQKAANEIATPNPQSAELETRLELPPSSPTVGPSIPPTPLSSAFPPDLIGPLDPVTHLRPLRPSRPPFVSNGPLIYSSTPSSPHPYPIDELGPIVGPGELEQLRQELATEEFNFRLQRQRLESLERKFWKDMNTKWELFRDRSEREKVPEAEWLKRWCDENYNAYRFHHRNGGQCKNLY